MVRRRIASFFIKEKINILVLLVFPILTTIMFLFFNSNIFGLNMSDPSWWQFLTSSFLNKGEAKYLNELVGYSLFVVPSAIIMFKLNKLKKYSYILLISLFLIPVVSAILRLHITPIFFPTTEISSGSSDILSSIIGFTPFVFAYYFNKNSSNILNYTFYFLILNYISLIFSIIYLKNLLITSILISIFLIIMYFYRKSIIKIANLLFDQIFKNFIIFILLIVVLSFFIIGPFMMFPKNIYSEKGIIDFITHLITMLLGSAVGFSIFYKKIN